MKILIATGIFPPESGGPATYSAGLAAALRSAGHSVRVLTYGSASRDEEGVRVVSRRGGAVVRYIRYAWNAFRLARKNDVVYTQGPVSEGFPATIGAWFARRPVTMKVVGDYAWEMAQQTSGESVPLLDSFLSSRHGGRVGMYERIERWTTRRADRVIVPSEYLATVVERWGVHRDRIQVIVNAVEPFLKTESREQVRSAFGVSDRRVILTAVRAVPWKGVDDLIECMVSLSSAHLLVVAGDGPELDRWKTLAGERKVNDRVRFLGRVDRKMLGNWYAAADAFALNSGYEGYPHVVAEAASFRVPCFVSDKGGNPETKNLFGEFVRVLPYRDVSAWTNALADVTVRSTSAPPEQTWTHGAMVQRTIEALSGKHDPLSVVMVSYDQNLLHPSSEVARRVASYADQQTSIYAVVISRSSNEDPIASGTDRPPHFFSAGVSGPGWLRVIRAIRSGATTVRRASHRVVLTCQDPFAAGLVGFSISRLTNTPYEIQEHGDFFSGAWSRESWKNRVWGKIGLFILRRADDVRAVSERVKEHLIARGIAADRIHVLPVAQDLSALLSQPLSSFRRPPTIVLPCRFVDQKGLDVALQAARLLKDRGVGFTMRLIGSGPREQRLRDDIRSAGLSDRVSLEPWRVSSALWDGADIFVLASRYEGWGRTIVEAMAAGVPIVTTDVGCVGSFFRPSVDGLVVPSNDSIALADGIMSCITSDDRREEMRQNARTRSATFPSAVTLQEQQRSMWTSAIRDGGASASSRRLWIAVAALILFSTVLHGVSVALFWKSLGANREWGFYTLVQHWFQGYGFSFVPAAGCASAYRSPGFLFFLVAVYSIFGLGNFFAQAVIQNALAVLLTYLVYRLGWSVSRDRRVGIIAGLVVTLHPYTFYHYTQYYHTVLSGVFLVSLLLSLLALERTRRLGFAVLTGIFIAGLAYIQGTILPATAFLSLWLLIRWRKEWKRAALAIAIMAVTSAGLIAPWTYRNWTVFHRFVPLTTDLGHAFAKANNENIFGLTRLGFPQEVQTSDRVFHPANPQQIRYIMLPEAEAALHERGWLRPSALFTEWHPKEPSEGRISCDEPGVISEPDFNAYWMSYGVDWLKKNYWPEGLELQGLKIVGFWSPTLQPSIKYGAPWSFGNTGWKATAARWSLAGYIGFIELFTIVGVVVMKRRKRLGRVAPFLIIFGVYTFLHSFFAGYTKYRIPLDALLAILAAIACVAVWDRCRSKHRKRDL